MKALNNTRWAKVEVSIKFYLKAVKTGYRGTKIVYIYFNYHKTMEGTVPQSHCGSREKAKSWIRKNYTNVEFFRE